MIERVDEKGKVFTEYIAKQSIPVSIYTPTCMIWGRLHVRPGQRLLDALNDTDERFLAITDAEIRSADHTRHLQRTRFLAVNKHEIVAIVPADVDRLQKQEADAPDRA